MMPAPGLLAACALVAGAAGFGGAWQVQSWRYTAQIASQQAQAAAATTAAVQAARATEQARNKTLQDAQHAAQIRAKTAQAAAAAAAADANSLRDTIAAINLQLPTQPPAACVARASTAGELLAQCADAYQALAATADRHASDVRTLMEAWPGE